MEIGVGFPPLQIQGSVFSVRTEAQGKPMVLKRRGFARMGKKRTMTPQDMGVPFCEDIHLLVVLKEKATGEPPFRGPSKEDRPI